MSPPASAWAWSRECRRRCFVACPGHWLHCESPGAAMAAANVPHETARGHVSGPVSAPDWASDAIPHLTYRAVICTALRFMSPDHVPAA